MRKARFTTLAIAAILLALGAGGVAPAESSDDSSGLREVGETAESAATEANSSASPEAPRDGDQSVDWDSEADDEWGDAGWKDEDQTDEDSDPFEWESDKSFSDRCHGIVSCSFTLVGKVIALPFRILRGVLRFVF